MAGVQIDGVNNKIDFDDDQDTSISANTDDTLVIEAGGNTMATITATTFTINDGTTITTADNTDTLTLTSTDTDANGGPNLRLLRSATGADADTLGVIDFAGKDDGGNLTDYARIEVVIDDASDGSEDASLIFRLLNGGALNQTFKMTGPETVINDASIDHDFRVESNGNANMLFVNGGTDRVGIGTNVPDMLLEVRGSASAGGGSDEKLQQWNIGSDNVKAEIEYLDTSSERGYAIGTSSQHHFMLRTNDATRIKINETGGLILTNPLNDVYAIDNQLTASSNNVYGQKNTFENHSPDNNTSSFYWGNDNVTARFGVYSDGDVKNHDNSYGSFSDERIKQNIRDANSQWDDIKAVKVRNYKKKDDVRQYGDSAWEQIGLIAQELEASGMDKLIKHANPSEADITSSSEFGTLNDDGTIKEIKAQVKGVSYTVLYMKALKALQEAMAKIETLEADVKTLKGE